MCSVGGCSGDMGVGSALAPLCSPRRYNLKPAGGKSLPDSVPLGGEEYVPISVRGAGCSDCNFTC